MSTAKTFTQTTQFENLKKLIQIANFKKIKCVN